MNMVLLFPQDFVNQGEVFLRGRRSDHIRMVLRAGVGDSVKVGKINGKRGTAQIVKIDEDAVTLEVNLFQEPPCSGGSVLVLALPRPLVLKRVLQAATALGIKQIHLVQSARVEKSFWSSPALSESALSECCVLGLEQAMDTVLPEVRLHKRFRVFAEDVLPELIGGRKKILVHPGNQTTCPRWIEDPAVIAIGPEGGWVDFEVHLLEEQGFELYSLGERILKVETAVAVVLGRLSWSRH